MSGPVRERARHGVALGALEPTAVAANNTRASDLDHRPSLPRPTMLIDLILLLIALLALLGHGALWIGAGNRIHGMGMPRAARAYLSQFCAVLFVLLPTLAAWWLISTTGATWGEIRSAKVPPPAMAYIAFCWIVAVVAIVRWIRCGPLRRRPEVLRSEHVERVRLADDSPGCPQTTSPAGCSPDCRATRSCG